MLEIQESHVFPTRSERKSHPKKRKYIKKFRKAQLNKFRILKQKSLNCCSREGAINIFSNWQVYTQKKIFVGFSDFNWTIMMFFRNYD